MRGAQIPEGEEGKDEGCNSTYYVTLVYDDYIDTFNHVYVTEAVVVDPLMLQIDVSLGVVASVWD